MILQLEGCRVDLEQQEVHRGGDVLPLTAHEHGLLLYLCERAGRAVRRDVLLEEVWGWRARRATRAVDNTVLRLRSKIELDPAAPAHLLTARGVGYRYDGPRPVQITLNRPVLLGRQAQLDALLARLSGGGLVSLVGPGGVGKTALAQALLSKRRGLFCDLSGAHKPHQLLACVADRLGVSADEDAISGALTASTERLLVLDNFEQLVESCWPLVEQWAGCLRGRAAIVVTSRFRLRVDAEHCIALPPLDVASGVALLQQRSGAAPAEPTALERQLVEAVDGLPLAIELVAGWADLAGAAELLASLSGRAASLESRSRRRVARHRSIEALMAHSWSLLTAPEAHAMRHLAALVGPFTVADATALLGAPALQLLGRLTDRSLLRRLRRDDDTVCFVMLELVRADALRRLAADPAEQQAAFRRHAAHVMSQGEALERLSGRSPGEFYATVSAHRGNIQAVFDRFCATEPPRAAAAELLLSRLASHDGSDEAALERLQAVLRELPRSVLRVQLRQAVAFFHMRLGRPAEGEAILRADLTEAWAGGVHLGAFAEHKLGMSLILRGEAAAACALLSGTAARADARGGPAEKLDAICAQTTGYLAYAHAVLGELAQASALYADGIAQLEALGESARIDYFREQQAWVSWRQGDLATAERRYQAALAAAEAARFDPRIVSCSLGLGTVLLETGRRAAARQRLTAGLVLGRGNPTCADACAKLQQRLGDLALAEGDAGRARGHWEQGVSATDAAIRVSTQARLALLGGERDRLAALRGSVPAGGDGHRQLQALQAGASGGDGEERIAGWIGRVLSTRQQ